MKNLPIGLIYFRLYSGILILTLSFFDSEYYAAITAVLFSLGLLSDIFDGIIARRLRVATQKLRRLDSLVDQVFFTCVTLALFAKWPGFSRITPPKYLFW